MLKPADNPPLLWPESPADLAALPGRWWVAHTKARFEKAFAWDLVNRGIAGFLPMVERVTFSGGRKRHAMMPLFASYLFFCGDESARYAAMTTNRLCQTIEVKDQPRLVRELSDLHRVLRGGLKIDPYPFAIIGQTCRIKAGPFQGIHGTLIRRDGVDRFVLQVSILGQGASLEVESDLVEPIV